MPQGRRRSCQRVPKVPILPTRHRVAEASLPRIGGPVRVPGGLTWPHDEWRDGHAGGLVAATLAP